MKRRADSDDDVPALAVSPSVGHYTTGFSAIIKDGLPVEPVSNVGPIGFVTRRPSLAVLKRLKKRTKE